MSKQRNRSAVSHNREIIQDELEAKFWVVHSRLEKLAKNAPFIRQQHLNLLHQKAASSRNEDCAGIILQVLHQ